jgi:hypothetical protein
VGIEAGQSLEQTWLARSNDFADALSAGPAVAATGGTLLLVDPAGLEDSLESGDFITEQACDIELARIVGGTAAISVDLFDEVAALLAACPVGVQTPPEQALVMGEPDEEEPAEPRDVIAGPFGFEEDAEGWTVSTSGNPATSWARGGPGHESETSFQVVPYSELADTSLTSPEIPTDGGGLTVDWSQTLDVEGGGFDELEVLYAVDGGDFISVGIFGGRNADFPEFSEVSVSFDAPAGNLQVRFRFFSDEICSSVPMPGVCATDNGFEGVRIDDVAISQ